MVISMGLLKPELNGERVVPNKQLQIFLIVRKI
jgi:hypothetical protein